MEPMATYFLEAVMQVYYMYTKKKWKPSSTCKPFFIEQKILNFKGQQSTHPRHPVSQSKRA